jgi:hypothetical protein
MSGHTTGSEISTFKIERRAVMSEELDKVIERNEEMKKNNEIIKANLKKSLEIGEKIIESLKRKKALLDDIAKNH